MVNWEMTYEFSNSLNLAFWFLGNWLFSMKYFESMYELEYLFIYNYYEQRKRAQLFSGVTFLGIVLIVIVMCFFHCIDGGIFAQSVNIGFDFIITMLFVSAIYLLWQFKSKY